MLPFPKLQADYNSKTEQKIDVILHNFFVCPMIGSIEILMEESKSMGESPNGELKGAENWVELNRKAKTRLAQLQTQQVLVTDLN